MCLRNGRAEASSHPNFPTSLPSARERREVAEFGGKVANPGEGHWKIAANNAGVPAHVLIGALATLRLGVVTVFLKSGALRYTIRLRGTLSRMGNAEPGAR